MRLAKQRRNTRTAAASFFAADDTEHALNLRCQLAPEESVDSATLLPHVFGNAFPVDFDIVSDFRHSYGKHMNTGTFVSLSSISRRLITGLLSKNDARRAINDAATEDTDRRHARGTASVSTARLPGVAVRLAWCLTLRRWI